jgi:hypothetical protein
MMSTAAAENISREQKILSDCAKLLEKHHQNVSAGHLESEELLLQAYVHQVSTEDEEEIATSVVLFFRGYIRQRRFLGATLSFLFPPNKSSLQSRHRILLGLLTFYLLFQPMKDQSFEPEHSEQWKQLSRWIFACTRLLSTASPQLQKVSAVDGKTLSGPAVALVRRLFGGLIGVLPASDNEKSSSSTERSTTATPIRPVTTADTLVKDLQETKRPVMQPLALVEGLVDTWMTVLEKTYVESQLMKSLSSIRLDLEDILQSMEEQVDGQQGGRMSKKPSTGT